MDFVGKFTAYQYVGRPISSDNGLISQKLLLKSEFCHPLNVAMALPIHVEIWSFYHNLVLCYTNLKTTL